MQVRKLAALLTLLAMVAALMPLTASVALGTGGNNPPDACYEEIHEDLYERPKFKTKYEYQKQTKTVKVGRITGNVTVVSDWDWWSPPNTQWSYQDVEVLEEGVHSNLSGNDTVFYDYTRYYRYVKNGNTQPVEDGTESSGWVPDGQVPDGDGWVLVDERTRQGDRIPCEIDTDPTFDVTPESLVCNPQTGEIEGQNDGTITFVDFDNGSWDATDLTGLSAGFHGPFTAKADEHFIFASTGTDTFSTGKVEVKAVGDEEPCDKLVTFCLDINTATLDELIQVNGLDATLAQAVIDGRPYESIDHMVEVVKGIGPVSVLPMMEPDSETGAFISDDCLTSTTPTTEPTTPTTEPTTPTTEPTTPTTEPEPEDPFANIDYWCDVDGLNLYLSEGEWQIAGWLLGERLWDRTFSVTDVNELGYAAFSLALEGADQFVVQTEGLSRVYVLDDCPIEPTEEPEEAEDETPSTLPFTGPSDHTGVLAGAGLLALIAGAGLTFLARKGEEDMA